MNDFLIKLSVFKLTTSEINQNLEMLFHFLKVILPQQSQTLDLTWILDGYFNKLEQLISFLYDPKVNAHNIKEKTPYQFKRVKREVANIAIYFSQLEVLYSELFARFIRNAREEEYAIANKLLEPFLRHSQLILKKHGLILAKKYSPLFGVLMTGCITSLNALSQHAIYQDNIDEALSLALRALRLAEKPRSSQQSEKSVSTHLEAFTLFNLAQINITLFNYYVAYHNLSQVFEILTKTGEVIYQLSREVDTLIRYLESVNELELAVALLLRAISYANCLDESRLFNLEFSTLKVMQCEKKCLLALESKFNDCKKKLYHQKRDEIFEILKLQESLMASIDESGVLIVEYDSTQFVLTHNHVKKFCKHTSAQFIKLENKFRLTRDCIEQMEDFEEFLRSFLNLLQPKLSSSSVLEQLSQVTRQLELNEEDKKEADKAPENPKPIRTGPKIKSRPLAPALSSYEILKRNRDVYIVPEGFAIPAGHSAPILVRSEHLGDSIYISVPKNSKIFEPFEKLWDMTGQKPSAGASSIPSVPTYGLNKQGIKIYTKNNHGVQTLIGRLKICGSRLRAKSSECQTIKSGDRTLKLLIFNESGVKTKTKHGPY